MIIDHCTNLNNNTINTSSIKNKYAITFFKYNKNVITRLSKHVK